MKHLFLFLAIAFTFSLNAQSSVPQFEGFIVDNNKTVSKIIHLNYLKLL